MLISFFVILTLPEISLGVDSQDTSALDSASPPQSASVE
jgi:hypothetical protein